MRLEIGRGSLAGMGMLMAQFNMVIRERGGTGKEPDCCTNIPSSTLSPHSMTLELATLLNIAIHN